MGLGKNHKSRKKEGNAVPAEGEVSFSLMQENYETTVDSWVTLYFESWSSKTLGLFLLTCPWKSPSTLLFGQKKYML